MPTASFSVQDPLQAVLSIRAEVRFTSRDFNGEPFFIAEDSLRSKFFRLGVAEYTFASLLDGQRTVAEAIGLSTQKLRNRAFSESEALAVCNWLIEHQLATATAAADDRLVAARQRQTKQRFVSLLNPLCVRIPLLDPSAVVDCLLPYCSWLFTRLGLAIWTVLIACGAWLAASRWDDLSLPDGLLTSQSDWLLLLAAWIALKVVHELAHATACRTFGGEVPRAGLFLILLIPTPFVDVTSSWRFASKWQRIITAAAGIYVELLIASLAIMLWAYTGDGAVHELAYRVLILASVGTLLINANPLMRFDGYYILADWLEIPNFMWSSQQYWLRMVRRWLGFSVPVERDCARTRHILLVYGGLALAWRMLVSLSLLLAFYAMVEIRSELLAWTVVCAVVAVPIYRRAIVMIRFFWNQPVLPKRRLALAVCGALAMVSVMALIAGGPSTVRAYGVVEYDPLTVVRATAAGFVDEVLVTDGQQVCQGQVLLRLRNDELDANLADIRLQLQVSLARSRSHRQKLETAKEQTEMANYTALKKKEEETASQAENLLVRAPSDGKIICRNIDSLAGKYTALGDELMMIANESSKVAILGVAQEELPTFKAQCQRPVTVVLNGGKTHPFQAVLDRIDPSASATPPHPALSEELGGPLAAKVKPVANGQKYGGAELTYPHFRAYVSFAKEQAEQLLAGEPATIVFHSKERSIGERAVIGIRQWVSAKIKKSCN